MHHIGIDIIEIVRIEKAIMQWREGFLRRVYTEPELKLYRNKLSSLHYPPSIRKGVREIGG